MNIKIEDEFNILVIHFYLRDDKILLTFLDLPLPANSQVKGICRAFCVFCGQFQHCV